MTVLEETIKALQARRSQAITAQAARFSLAYIRLLAEGKPVAAARLAHELGDPVEFVSEAFQQMRDAGAEFNAQGDLIGSALTLSPTRHQFVVDHISLYAWCALDTMFLPAYIGKTVHVTSVCPVTNKTVSLVITPDVIETFSPSEAVVSIMTGKSCTSGIAGTFCSQVNYFASRKAALEWIGKRPDFAILTISEAFQLAKHIYIEPVIKYA